MAWWANESQASLPRRHTSPWFLVFVVVVRQILEKGHNSGHQEKNQRFVRFPFFLIYMFLILFYFKVLNGDKRRKRLGIITFCMVRASRVRGTTLGQQRSQIRITISGYLMESRRQQRGIGLTSLETSHSSMNSPWKRLCCYLRSTQLSKGMSIATSCTVQRLLFKGWVCR